MKNSNKKLKIYRTSNNGKTASNRSQSKHLLIIFIPMFAAILFAASFIIAYTSFTGNSVGDGVPVSFEEKDSYNFLIAGLDKVGYNTDVMMLVSYKTKENSVSVLQIPRDTYFDVGNSTCKINQVFSSHLMSSPKVTTSAKHAAMHQLCSDVGECFGITIDYYILSTIDGFSSFIDSIGGVEVNLPFDMNYSDPAQGLEISLRSGKQVLDGNKAAQFVRYRYGYIEGDVGRVDAQKIFLGAFYTKVKDKLGISMALSVINDFAENSITNLPIKDAVFFARDFMFNSSNQTLYVATLPGEATRRDGDSGLWYYIANRDSSYEIITQKMKLGEVSKSDFDKNGILNSADRENISNIYNAKFFDYSMFSLEDIDGIKIYTSNVN